MVYAALAILETNKDFLRYLQYMRAILKLFSKSHNSQDTEDTIQTAFFSVANNLESFFSVPAEKRVSYMNMSRWLGSLHA